MIETAGRWYGCLAGAALAALLALGCGGDDDSPSRKLRILVTNDDGVAAEGIDAIVQALVADRDNDVVVCAPAGNRSGSGDMMGPSERCGDLSVIAAPTLSGYPATAVDGCPADTVVYALAEIYAADAPPDVVISGINEGQNISELIATTVSGTVGAARTAAGFGLPALAASQGIPEPGAPYDYPYGVEAVLAWLDANRAALLAGPGRVTAAANLNIPSCASGSVRGILEVPLAASTVGALDTQDCTSTLQDPVDDVEAFRNGFITLSYVPID